MFKAERDALRSLFQGTRPSLRQTLEVAALYSAQAIACILLLEWGYGRTKFEGVFWALVSAILALQPGFQQSVVTSVLRVLANTVGACVALLIGRVPWTIAQEAKVILAIVIVVFVCELTRLEQAMRTACVAVLIVLTVGAKNVVSSGEQRFTATIIGCAMALVVQLVTDLIREKLFGRKIIVETTRSSKTCPGQQVLMGKSKRATSKVQFRTSK